MFVLFVHIHYNNIYKYFVGLRKVSFVATILLGKSCS